MFILALTDFLAFSYDGILDMFFVDMGIDFAAMSEYGCKILKLYSWITTIVSYYIISMLSLDKCMAVWIPVTYKIWGTPKVALIASVIAYLCTFLMCIPAALVYTVVPSGKCKPASDECLTRRQFLNYVYVLTSLIDFFIPVLVVAVASAGSLISSLMIMTTSNCHSRHKKFVLKPFICLI